MKKISLLLALGLLLGCCGCTSGWGEPNHAPAEQGDPAAAEKPAIYLYPDSEMEPVEEKPVIHLYPEEKTEIRVTLDYAGTITASYPPYHDGWHVWATPDGTITDESGREYPYLFWEGAGDVSYDFRRGFVVAGADTLEFLEEKLAVLGLNDKETADFITYWLPRMQDNPYNLIAFQGRAYTDAAKLTVEPAPDTEIRVFMAWKPLEEPMEIPEQELPRQTRSGFTVVEWGGAELS